MKKDKVLGGLVGLCVGDALGLPVEFVSREELKQNPVTDLIGYKTHNQPPGTWSDDSSLAFCIADSLRNGFNLSDIADKFVKWFEDGLWTPYGYAFDYGRITAAAIHRLAEGIDPLKSGLTDEYSNGNGSLMRTLPLAFYLENLPQQEQFEITHKVSSITHAHPRSQIACGIYIQLAINLLKGESLNSAYEKTKTRVLNYYSNREPFNDELKHFERILIMDISGFPEDSIKSSGYVVDTLEASLWCLFNNDNYRDTALCAVNLGGDSDTTGAVAGGLAGIYYGYKNIPYEWIEKLARIDDIIRLGERLCSAIYREK